MGVCHLVLVMSLKVGVGEVDRSEVLTEAGGHEGLRKKTTQSSLMRCRTPTDAIDVLCQQRGQAAHHKLRDRRLTLSLSSPQPGSLQEDQPQGYQPQEKPERADQIDPCVLCLELTHCA
jgi:hypothetical protein